jgi:hypothetical protein
MTMSASDFLAQFKRIKAYLNDHPDAPDELRQAYASCAAGFKAAFTPEQFKQALSSGQSVDSDLEERVTSALMLLNRLRASGPRPSR